MDGTKIVAVFFDALGMSAEEAPREEQHRLAAAEAEVSDTLSQAAEALGQLVSFQAMINATMRRARARAFACARE